MIVFVNASRLYVYSKTVSPYPDFGWTVSPYYLAIEIIQEYICIGCCIYIIGMDLRLCMNSTCVELHIPSTVYLL